MCLSVQAESQFHFSKAAKHSDVKIKVKGYTTHLYYYQNQSNHLIITAHGYLDNCSYMNYLHRPLWKNGHSLLCIDLPGHGQSTGARADINSFDTYGKILKEIPRDILNHYDKISFIAHSTGAVLLHEYLRTAGDIDFYKIVLLAPLVRSKLWHLSVAGNYLLGSFIETLERKNLKNKKFKKFTSQDKFLITHMRTHWFGELKAWNDRLEQKPKKHYQDMTVYFPSEDEVIDLDYNLSFYKKYFPNAQIKMLPAATHRIQFDSDALVDNFVQEITQSFNE